MVNEINAAKLAELGLAQQTTSNAASKELGQEEFLDLLVAQLQYQDPIKPLENAEFVSQVAQFSSVSGLSEIQKSLGDLVGAFQSNQALQASTLVGREVLLPSTALNWSASGTQSGALEVASNARAARVEIFDSAGALVRRLDLVPNGTERVAFDWDGRDDAGAVVAPGQYEVRGTYATPDGDIAASTLLRAKVDSVSLGRNPPSTTLNVAGFGAVDVLDVREFL